MGALVLTLYILACLAGYCVWEEFTNRHYDTERGKKWR